MRFWRFFSRKAKASFISDSAPRLRVLVIEENQTTCKQIAAVLSPSFEIIDCPSIDSLTAASHFEIALISHSIIRNINATEILAALKVKVDKPFRAFALISFYSEAQKLILIDKGFERLVMYPIDLV